MSTFGAKEFEPKDKGEIQTLLESKLAGEHLAQRAGNAGAKYTYVESHKAISLANSIFGFNGWSSSIVDITPDFVEEAGGRFRVGVTAVVKVMLQDGTFHEDVGYGLNEHPKKGNAIENAKKEAVTDARKRALRLFGNALGNCIYDKQHLNTVARTVKSFTTKSVSYKTIREAAAAGELDDPAPAPVPLGVVPATNNQKPPQPPSPPQPQATNQQQVRPQTSPQQVAGKPAGQNLNNSVDQADYDALFADLDDPGVQAPPTGAVPIYQHNDNPQQPPSKMRKV